GAAMVGIGLLLAAPPGAPAPVIADVQLVNTERMLPLGPQDCLLTAEACGGGGRGGFLFGNGGNGGNGLAAEYDEMGVRTAPTPGGNGGRASFFFGNGA